MQAYQLEVNDDISDKILWLLNSFKNDVKIKKIQLDDSTKVDKITSSVKKALDEVEYSKEKGASLNNAWDLVDEL